MNTETLKAQNETLAQDSTKSKLSFKSESDLERYCVDWHREKEEYNGWSNYATWRINLEMINGGYTEMLCDDDIVHDSVYELSEHIKQYVEDVLSNASIAPDCNSIDNILYGYAMAFFDDVNWYEIASHIAEYYPSIIKASDDGL